MRENKDAALQEYLDKEAILKDFVERILSFDDIKEIKSVIVYGSYLTTPKDAKDIDIIIIYNGNKELLQYLQSSMKDDDISKFHINIFDKEWVKGWKNDEIIGKREILKYGVLYGQDLFS